MYKNKVQTIGFATLLFLLVVPVIAQKAGRLEDSRISIDLVGKPLGLVMRTLVSEKKILIGFEQSALDRVHNEYIFDTNLPARIDNPTQVTADGKMQVGVSSSRGFFAKLHPITLQFADTPIKTVMDELVRQMENYSWEVKDGVINIFPVKGRDKKLEALLNLKIDVFELKPGSTVKDITTKIRALPEFDGFLNANDLAFDGFRGSTMTLYVEQYGRILDEGLTATDITLRDLLNRLVILKKSGGWIVQYDQFYKEGTKERIDLDI